MHPRNALSNVFEANNVRPYGYTPANLFDAVRRGRRTLRCTVKSFGSIYRVERHKVNCPKDKRPPGGGTTSAHRLYPLCTIYSVGAHIVRPRNALSNVFRANNVRPSGYAPANLFDAVRRGRRTLRCTVLLWYI